MVLGPHPDDPESVAIACRLFMRNGCDIRYCIVTLSPAGVEDIYADRWRAAVSTPLDEVKMEIRRTEQVQAAERFGLAADDLIFLGLQKGEGGTLDSAENRRIIEDLLVTMAPDIVIMPVGRDTNATHAPTR